MIFVVKRLTNWISLGGGVIPIMKKVVIGSIFGMALGVLGIPFIDMLFSNVSPLVPGAVSMVSGTILGIVTALKVIV